jgi:hypothetical protein
MKRLVFLGICFALAVNVTAQVVSSGKVSILINNKEPVENKQKAPVVFESNALAQSPTGNELPYGLGKYYALIIGINDYTDPQINDLDYCIRDAESFYTALVNLYTFEKENVRFLKNASMSDMVTSLDYFAEKVKPNDNFLIFYAGHGVWNPTSEIGFWLPSDARKSSTLNWFRNSALRDYLRAINSKHTLLITDACFGGSIFKSRAAFSDATLAVNKLYELPSRKAMTSGTSAEEVPDQSAFLKYMIERLGTNKEKYLSSEQLFSSLRSAVINNSNVVPQFGEIKDVGDQGGDFIFIHR